MEKAFKDCKELSFKSNVEFLPLATTATTYSYWLLQARAAVELANGLCLLARSQVESVKSAIYVW